MLPIYNSISEEEIISRIKAELRLVDTSEHDLFLEILIREGLASLNCLTQLQKKQCTLIMEDGKFKLPNDLVSFIALRPKCSDDKFIYADLDFLNKCGCDITGLSGLYGVQIQKGFIFFNSNLEIEEADIVYMGLWIDENGKRVVFERYERALTAYACWKFSRSWFENYNQYIMQEYKNEWILQRDKLKAEDVQKDFELNKRQISEIFRAWLVSPIVNY